MAKYSIRKTDKEHSYILVRGRAHFGTFNYEGDITLPLEVEESKWPESLAITFDGGETSISVLAKTKLGTEPVAKDLPLDITPEDLENAVVEPVKEDKAPLTVGQIATLKLIKARKSSSLELPKADARDIIKLRRSGKERAIAEIKNRRKNLGKR